MEISVKQSALSKNIAAEKALALAEKSVQSLSIAERFAALVNFFERYRFIVMPAFILFQGCISVPVTILLASFYDIGLGDIAVGLLAVNTLALLVSGLAIAPMKVMLSIFLFSTLSSLIIIAMHLLAI